MNSGLTQRTVLVVEDDQGCVELISEVVSDLGHLVIVCDSVSEATRLVSSQSVNLVILDVMLPDGDGFSVLAAIRGNVETKHIPVVLCTAALFEVTAYDKPIDDPLTDIVAKPFHIDTFVGVVTARLA